jgi:diguanylate cyclase (GGDEF)-like protein
MSFRSRLTLFFVLIVVVPMTALGFVVVRLVSDSERGKAAAQNRVSAAAAVASYERLSAKGARDAQQLAADDELAAALAVADPAAARARARELAELIGLVRVRITKDGRPHSDLGDRDAIAGGMARVRLADGAANPNAADYTIETSSLTPERFARATSVLGVRTVVRREGAVLASTLPAGALADAGASPAGSAPALPADGTVDLGGTEYTVSTFRGSDFDGKTTTVTILTDTTSAASAATRGQWIAVGLLVLFLLLAFAGALLISRQLHGQLERFLAAAKRIGGGDFSATVPIEGDDEFAALGREFNKMSSELEQRLRELDQERARLRESIERVGATFASNLDRAALLEIGLQTIADAVQAECGRAAIRTTATEAPDAAATGEQTPDGDLLEGARVGNIAGAEAALAAAEVQAREHAAPAVATAGEISALAVPMARRSDDGDSGAPHGIVSVARRARPFTDAERDLVASLARQTGTSLENVDLHDVVKRQAVTDELTGLFNHRRFQEVIAAEAAAARRFGQPLGLLMLDIDDFKRVNDRHGHQQGDLVLREVARVLQLCTREIDEPARYGGEEMAVALQQTDLAGAEAIAERVRTTVQALELPRLDGGGTLRVTVSCGVAAAADGDPERLIAAADAALYAAKRAGKNRTVCAAAPPVAAGT